MRVDDAIRVIAGLFIILSVVLSKVHNPNWIYFTVFVGLNLLQSGFTKKCPMITILKKIGLKSCEN